MYQNMTASGDVQKELGVLISGITAVLKLQLPLQLDLHRAVVVGTMHEGDMKSTDVGGVLQVSSSLLSAELER
jgi:hypothetical protein